MVLSLSQNGYGNVKMGQTETPRREEWSVVKSPRFEAGDGHKHGCFDAFTFALGSFLEYEHAALVRSCLWNKDVLSASSQVVPRRVEHRCFGGTCCVSCDSQTHLSARGGQPLSGALRLDAWIPLYRRYLSLHLRDVWECCKCE